MLETQLKPRDARVLMVEDSPNDQEIATRALKNFGIRHWRLAKTAEDALHEVAKHEFDVVLVDYSLPGMNGLQFVEQLRAIAPETRIIMVTGARQESVAVAAMKLGASDYISKDEFLTSGIIRSLQAALRARVTAGETVQRETLSTASLEPRDASIEGAWLVQALDDRHGYTPADQGIRDALGEQWADAVSSFVAYLRASYESFPDPATEHEDAVIRILNWAGASPRDVFRVYVAAIREMTQDVETSSDRSLIKPIYFLTHILACMIEEYQLMLVMKA
ncbi:MAG TPA: response regulator [Dehalococcoidia bacterium]|nr:response regulator [Dehalococcoidia bacterium]